MPTRIAATVACLLLTFAAAAAPAKAGDEDNLIILSTTFPIHQFTRNLADGADRVEVRLMLPADMGCPHDYALTPRDMAMLEQADLVIINGLGMEDFIAAPLRSLDHPPLVVDASARIDEDQLIPYADHDDHRHDAEQSENPGQHRHDENCEHDGHHHHGTALADDEIPNPHLTVSPSMAALMVENIAAALSAADPANADVYQTNVDRYAVELRQLAREFAEAGNGLANRKVIETHGAFDYLARDAGLEIIAAIQPEGRDMAAAEILHVLELVKDEKPVAILVEPGFPTRTADMLKRETGLPVVALDPVVTGPDDAPIDYYQRIMRGNAGIIAELGKQ